ncbi:MAG: response regulator [Capsulimonadales bacterium]|nr:response regulator [Capsulimonadales bacterium]
MTETEERGSEGAPATTDSIETGLRALICEDEPLTVLLLERTLRNAGIQVVGKAKEGQAGIELARATRPDFVLMDINMPGMSGIEATRRLTAEHPLPIIMLTAYGDVEHVDEAIEAGACAYLVKPIAHADLIPAIRRAIALFETCQALDDQYRSVGSGEPSQSGAASPVQ